MSDLQRLHGQFNFRDVLSQLGIDDSDKTVNWAVGHILRKEAGKHQVAVDHVLTKKTNSSPTVVAPHCIAAYPAAFLPVALSVIEKWWGDRSRQLDLFEHSGNSYDQ